MGDWRESFDSWLHPGALAHPDSPAGGSGCGSSRVPGSDVYWTFPPGVAHPESPTGKILLIPPSAQPQSFSVNSSATEKLKLAAERAIPKMPKEIRAKVKGMLTPSALATMAAIGTVWAASHYFGVGEVVDVLLLGWGVVTLGPEVWTAAKDLYGFATISINARNDQDIDRAANDFAEAITIIGVDGLAAILAHKAFKAVGDLDPAARGGVKVPEATETDIVANEKSASGTDTRGVASVVSKEATARSFYEKAGWSDEKIAAHMDGIDFSKNVDVVTLPKGTQVIQYQLPGKPVGNYFAPPGTAADTIGINPAGRVANVYTTTQDISVLRSTAADTTSNLNLPPSVRGAGGSTQYFTTNTAAFDGGQ